MSFLGELIKIADTVTLDLGLQCEVQHYAFIGSDARGKPTYADPVTVTCVVDRTNREISTANGKVINISATLTKIGDLAPNGAVTNPARREPIDPRDKIVLPDGLTGPIIDTPGSVTDPETDRGFIQSIMLGAR